MAGVLFSSGATVCRYGRVRRGHRFDITQYVVGPHCTQFLATMGTDVIKVEPVFGDPYRHNPSFFRAYNLRGKRSVRVALRDERGQQVVQDLAASADVFVQSYRSGKLAQLDLDYEPVSVDSDEIVYCSLSGFGRNGPYSD